MWPGICPRIFEVVEYIIVVTISKFHISSYYNTSTYYVRFSKVIYIITKRQF